MAPRQQYLTGDKELDDALKQLGTTLANRIAKTSIRAGVRVLQKAIKDRAKGTVKDQIGSKVKVLKSSKQLIAKAGVNVGNAGKERTPGPAHAHLFAIGSQKRFRKRIGGRFAYLKRPTSRQRRTEKMPSNKFVDEALSASQGQIKTAMHAAARKSLIREADKIAKRAQKSK